MIMVQKNKNIIIIVVFCLLVGFSVLQYKNNNELKDDIDILEESIMRFNDREDSYTRPHYYNIKISNCDQELHDVVLKYKSFTENEIKIGVLPASDCKSMGGSKEHVINVHIEDMVDPISFEVKGIREDGSVFHSKISGFDINEENETFESVIEHGSDSLVYR